MVLERLKIAALGAAGLLIAYGVSMSAARAQGQIPAPDAYGDITNCDTKSLNPVNRPFGMGDYEEKSVLDTIFEGFRITEIANSGTNSRASLTMQINPCNDSPEMINDIASGFAKARDLYADTASTVEGTEAYATAKAAQDAFGGEVYDHVYNEAAARRAVNTAIDDFNDLVEARSGGAGTGGEFTEAKAARDLVVINDLEDDETNIAGAGETTGNVREYGDGAVRGFQAITNYDPASWTAFDADSDGVVDASELGNSAIGDLFDGEGDLTFVQNVPDTPAGAMGAGVAGSANITALGQISTQLADWELALSSAEDVLADMNPDTTTTADYDAQELRVSRLKVVRDHVQNELERLTAVARRHASTSDVDDIAEYEAAVGSLNRAEDRVRSAAAGLQSANNRVKSALESPDSYFSQLVKLRQYEKGVADKALADAGEDPADSLVSAAEDAAMALTRATAQRDAYQALQGETDNPASKLLAALLQPEKDAKGKDNPADDDGQALVNAISETYDVAKGAADEARQVVDELLGEGGQVAMNTAGIAENKTMLADHETRIGANETMLTAHGEMLMDHEGRISTNASEIMRVEGRVDSNWDAIADNQTAIGMNTSAIADNASAIGRNSGMISDNSRMIGELSDSLDVVRAGVAASMALAGMPAINGRGVSIGIGSYDGESAFAVGFQIQGEMASFKVGVTSAGGETGASAGVGFQF